MRGERVERRRERRDAEILPEVAGRDFSPAEPREATPAAESADLDPGSDVSDDDVQAEVEAPPVIDDRPLTAAHARLGSEGVSRLRARYADIIASISDRIQDPARQEELRAQAERLNPDGWVTADEVTAGLEQYEAVFDSLRAVVGRRRRRRRGRPGTPKNAV